MPSARAMVIKRANSFFTHWGERFDEFEVFPVRLLFQARESLVADGMSPAPLEAMIIVIENFPKWALVHHRLLPLGAVAWPAFPRLDGQGAELKAAHRALWLRVALQDSDSVKAGVLKRSKKSFLGER